MALALLDPPLDRPRTAARLSGARALSYASSVEQRHQQVLIRTIENATGRLGLIRRAAEYEAETARGADFWRLMMDCYGLRLDVLHGALEAIPAKGPLVVVANHPFGILDGLAMGYILSALRGDFRILAHRVFARAEVLQQTVLPVSFDATREAQALNLATRAAAIDFLRNGGAVGIFPGGTVSTAPRPFGRPMDPAWRGFTARMIAKSGATVVPVWFEGQNSGLFQLASHLNQTLRVALLMREFRARLGRPVRLAIGAPIPAEALSHFGANSKQMMDFLRRKTYELSPEALDPAQLGHEFEAQHRQAGQDHGSWRFRFGARRADGSFRA